MSEVFDWAAAGDLPEIRRFLGETFGPGSIQAAPGRFDWLCAEHPGGLHVSLCRVDGRLVAVCCHVPASVALDDTTVAAAYGFDFMVAPEHRGRGIGRRFLEMRLERFAVSLSTGQSPAMAALYRKAGATVAGRFQHALHVKRPPWRGAPRALARDWLIWAWGLGRTGRGDVMRTVAPAEAAALLSRLPARLAPGESGPLTDGARLLWRYAGPAYRDYVLAAAEGAATPQGEGLLVSRLAARELRVVDLYGAPAAWPALLRAAVRSARAGRVSATFVGERPASAFRAAGFLVRPAQAELVVMSRQADLHAELARRRWVLFAGEADADLLRLPAAAPAAAQQPAGAPR